MKNDLKSTAYDKAIVILLALIIAVVPLIVRLNIVTVSPFEYQSIKSVETIADIFSYYKGVALITLSSLVLLICLINFFAGELRIDFKDKIFILTVIYLMFVILSSVFSKYNTIVLRGLVERYESVWVLLSYMIIFLAAYFFVTDRDKLNLIIYAIFISMAIVGTIGFFQFIGKDFFHTDIANKLVLGKYYGHTSPLKPVFDNVYSTLYNPNYAGLYASMLIPFCLVLSALLPIKSYLKYISIWFLVLMLTNLIGSDSAGALIGATLTILIFFIMAIIYFIYTKKYKHLTRTIIASVLMIIVVLTGFTFANGFIRAKIMSVASLLSSSHEAENPYFFNNLAINGYEVEFDTKSGIIYLVYNDDDKTLLFKSNDKVYEPVASVMDSKNDGGMIYSYSLDNFGELAVQRIDKIISVKIADIVFLFRIADDGLTLANKALEPLDINQNIRSFGFKGNELFATGRGYIWSRSLPVCLDYLFIGSGPDTFVFTFPVDDVLGKLKFLGSPYITVDKAHNFYIQTAINTGFLSLVCLLAIFAVYIIQTVRIIFFKNKKQYYILAVQAAFLGAVASYLITCLSTDSVVSVAPVFWVILGTGFAANRIGRS